MGQLIRILIILFGVWLIVYLVRRTLSRREGGSKPSSTHMVACSVCGTHVPESEAVQTNGKVYCSETHRKIAEKA